MVDTVDRPWHGKANPYEALHDWMKGELARLEARLPRPVAPPVVSAPVAPVQARPVENPAG